MVSRVYAIAASVVADAIRRKVVYVVLLFAGVMTAAIPLLPSYGVGVVTGVYREVALTLSYAAGIAVVLALCANRIPGEVERRTVYNVLARSVRRWEYLIGTWVGVFVTMFGVMAAFGVVLFVLGWMIYGQPMWQLWQGVFAIWLEVGVLGAFAVAVSSVSGPVIVATASLVFIIIAHVRAGLLSPDQLAWKLYPSLDTFNIINPVAHGTGVGLAYLATMVAVFAAWAIALLLLGALGFERRDL